jgi:DNA-binding transcriptional MerR regulator
MAGLTIGKFAAAEGVGVETVRFYHRRGLLALPERQGSGYREYSEADRWRLAFIRRARRLGFTLGEIRDLLGPAEARDADEIVRAAEAKLKAIEGQISELAVLQAGSGGWCGCASTVTATTASPCTSRPSRKEANGERSQDRDR